MSRERYTPLYSSVRHSAKLASLPNDTARMFYLLLLAQCDAWGRIDARPIVLLAEVWPIYGQTVESTKEARDALIAAALIELHRADDGSEWIQVPDWEDKAGRVGKRDHRAESRWPDPSDETRASPGQSGPSRATTGQRGPRRANAGQTGPSLARARARDLELELEQELEQEHLDPAPGASPPPAGRVDAEDSDAGPDPRPPNGADGASDTEPDGSPPPGAAPPSKPEHERGTPATRLWDRLWFEHRGVRYAWTRTGKNGRSCPDAIAMAAVVKALEGDLEELERRIRRMLTSPELFDARNASPRHLLAKLNAFAVEIRPLPKNGVSPEQGRAIADLFRAVP